MSKSTRSQDALLAVVVLLTLFAVPALEVYVQLTHRDDVWGPAVKGLFGLGFALSIGLGYRKWERDRTARASAPGRVEPAPVTTRSSPTHIRATPRERSRIDPLHVSALAVVLAFMLGAALVYFLFWPRNQQSPSAEANSRETPASEKMSDETPRQTTKANTRKTNDADYALWERCMEKHCEGEMWAGGECQHTAEEGANLEEWCREEWAATKRCSKKHCARFETE